MGKGFISLFQMCIRDRNNGQFHAEAAAIVCDGRLRISQDGLAAEAPAAACRLEDFVQNARAYRDGREYQDIYL